MAKSSVHVQPTPQPKELVAGLVGLLEKTGSVSFANVRKECQFSSVNPGTTFDVYVSGERIGELHVGAYQETGYSPLSYRGKVFTSVDTARTRHYDPNENSICMLASIIGGKYVRKDGWKEIPFT